MKAQRCELGGVAYTRIFGGDSGTSNVYCPVIGVPPDGRTVEAEAFVLGTTRVVSLQGIEGGKCAIAGGHWMYATDAGRVFGCEIPVGEFRQFAIVPLAEPQSEGETVQKQASKVPVRCTKCGRTPDDNPKQKYCGDGSDKDNGHDYRPVQSPVPTIAESPECGTEKVTLHRLSHSFYAVFHGDRRVGDFGELVARLIHPYHTLQPGECCEVPARENTPSQVHRADYRDCLDVAAAIAKTVECYGGDDLMEVISPHLEPVIGELQFTRDLIRNCQIHSAYRDCGYEQMATDQKAVYDWIRTINNTPVPSAPPVAESEGPRWSTDGYAAMPGLTIGAFIMQIGDHDYYAATMELGPGIARVDRYRVRGFELLDSPDRTCRNWVETSPMLPIAKEYREAYDRALSAGQLPEHPRWAKPEGAEVFLGWGHYEVIDKPVDFWFAWRNNRTGIVMVDNVGFVGCSYVDTGSRDYGEAWDKARELHLPQRADLKARIASLRAARDTATADLEAAQRELRAIGGGA